MLHLLKRHPIPISAFFRHSLVLTYALPPETLEPLLPKGLVLDLFRGHAFLAIALVDGASPAQFPSRGHGAGFLLERLSDLHSTGQRSAIEARVADLAQRHRPQKDGVRRQSADAL